MAVVPRERRVAQKSHLTWRELLAHDFITLQRPSAVRLMLEERLLAHGYPLKVTFESHQLVTVGHRVSAVPALSENQMVGVGAACLPQSHPTIERQIGVIRTAHGQLSTAATALLNTFREQFRVG